MDDDKQLKSSEAADMALSFFGASMENIFDKAPSLPKIVRRNMLKLYCHFSINSGHHTSKFIKISTYDYVGIVLVFGHHLFESLFHHGAEGPLW